MPVPKDDPVTKCTIFLYDNDIEEMKRRFGYGWSARIRGIIHLWLKNQNKTRGSLET